MISKEDVISVIKELYDGKPVAFSKIKRKIKADPEEIERVLNELEREGLVKKYDVGGGKAYEVSSIDGFSLILSEIRKLKEEIKRLQNMIVERQKLSVSSFDDAYDRVKDSLGYAKLGDIRLELGLSKEEFYSKFRSHVESNYELIAGGDEGFVRKGSIYGIIKKKG
ncbi:hypothetical protein EWF20_07980 [Sulfolobus sp. S-194]|uniref:hypothetical protein n=1 Tax=Sulfolobus sp. S-194 TaxID=2512240 RepID=UPI001437331D|nr:hypothetical protein [Sulfolobus sp. S-194]QIW24088.1 hypothetical protein EWF20_07980 [Sulfolobus sp. S-194]